jgi:hypothetical protein
VSQAELRLCVFGVEDGAGGGRVRPRVGPAAHQPVQHGEKHHPFESEPVPALLRQFADHRPAAGLIPQPLEHQARPDPKHRHRQRGFLARRFQHQGLRRKARPRTDQTFQLPTRCQRVEPAQGGDHLLAHLVAHPPALDDLQTNPPARLLLTEVHHPSVVRTDSPTGSQKQSKSAKTWHYIIVENPAAIPFISIAYGSASWQNCRRRV